MAPFDWGPLLGGGPLFLGILNLTPDSFSDGGRFAGPAAALEQAHALVQAGAGMLDLGAESTRPGAEIVAPDTEWSRLEPVLSSLAAARPGIPLSLDTRYALTASRGLATGVRVINDVTGFSDPAMLALAAHSPCGLIAMRSRRAGAGFHMPPYDDPAPRDAEQALAELRAVRDRLLGAGISPERLLLDPGFGFGTTFAEDLALWEALPRLPELLDWPAERFCIGLSRKRFLAIRAGRPDLAPNLRDGLTAQAHAEAAQWGYQVFRTHAIA
ncbi:dihydropteroate synthase [Geothrix sp.]|jgi:dihydropteroate synthase|uniref:dihydropteroate synthase n=1 Tax=Geothrix sp. TaxID=1962974 RepID=UPI0025C44CE5|nr:dihydropteroate synthase [Geothrix sp.]